MARLRYRAFDPLRDRGQQLFEVASVIDDEAPDVIGTTIVASKATYEDACRAPWFYLVITEVDREPEEG